MTQKLERPLLLMGCGKMGSAMLDGWLETEIASAGVFIVDPYLNPKYEHNPLIRHYKNATDIPQDLNPEIVILAVKPQQMEQALEAYRIFARPETTFISIAAGKTLSYFAEKLGPQACIIRAMPNTPAAIQQGVTVAVGNKNISTDQMQMTLTLLSAVGKAFAVETEDMMDAVTALSGGGPAYTFHMIETMTQAGIEAGLPADLSAQLAEITIAGSGQLALHSDESPAQLRKNVTSPNGTTQEALAVLMNEEDGLQKLMTRAIAAATQRSRDLAQD